MFLFSCCCCEPQTDEAETRPLVDTEAADAMLKHFAPARENLLSRVKPDTAKYQQGHKQLYLFLDQGYMHLIGVPGTGADDYSADASFIINKKGQFELTSISSKPKQVGLGRLMMNLLIVEAERRGFTEIMASATDSPDFYITLDAAFDTEERTKWQKSLGDKYTALGYVTLNIAKVKGLNAKAKNQWVKV